MGEGRGVVTQSLPKWEKVRYWIGTIQTGEKQSQVQDRNLQEMFAFHERANLIH